MCKSLLESEANTDNVTARPVQARPTHVLTAVLGDALAHQPVVELRPYVTLQVQRMPSNKFSWQAAARLKAEDTSAVFSSQVLTGMTLTMVLYGHTEKCNQHAGGWAVNQGRQLHAHKPTT